MAWTKWFIAGATSLALLGACRSDDAGIGGGAQEGEQGDISGHEDHAKSSEQKSYEEEGGGTGGSGHQHEDTQQGSPLEGDTSAQPNYEGPDTDIASPSNSDERE